MDLVSYNQQTVDYVMGANRELSKIRAIVLAPIVEEFIFRGYIFKIREGKNTIVTVIVSSFIFGGVHIISQVMETGIMSIFVMIPYVILGIGLSITYVRTGKLCCAVLFHAAFNTMMIPT